MKNLNIGLFGFGNVGRGLYDVLQRINSNNVHIKRICVRHIEKERGIKAEFTDNPDDIFDDRDINLIVEVIDDAEAAYDIVKRALKSRIPVVSGNKKMLGHHIIELIDLQELVPDDYQADCIWVMNRATRKAIRKLKDGQGNYLLEKDSTAKWGYRIMGADVYCSDNIKALGNANAPVVMYGDFSGLAVKEGEKTEIQVLTERFATQHAVGVVAWGELDAKVEDTQKIAVAVTGSAT